MLRILVALMIFSGVPITAEAQQVQTQGQQQAVQRAAAFEYQRQAAARAAAERLRQQQAVAEQAAERDRMTRMAIDAIRQRARAAQ